MRKKITRQNAPLLIGLSLPVLMIIIIALSIYLPRLFIKPRYNFLYIQTTDSSDREAYAVEKGQLIIYSRPKSRTIFRYPQLYLHNVNTNESKSLSFEEAQQLRLDANTTSPDGFKLEDKNQPEYGIFPFVWYDRDDESEYLIGNNTTQKLNLQHNGPSYAQVHFIGWVIN